jgi:zinc D-Ala-D-Ala carboxypeptidase
MKYLLLFALCNVLLFCQSVEQKNGVAAINEPQPTTGGIAQQPSVQNNIEITTDFLTGRFNPSKNTDFVAVGKPYTTKTGMMMQSEAFESFKKMFDAAQKDGISLNIISSTRNFDQQKAIWEGKWARFADTKAPVDRALRILEYSSMPGSSRHHWGTDIDLNDLNNPSFEGKGVHAKVYQWLVTHAAKYGFGQPYTPIGTARPYGYHEEKWHWSYLPLAKKYRTQYVNTIKDEDINGFKGAETAIAIKVVERFVGGVSADCQ